MQIDKLIVTNFKNFEHAEVDFSEGVNLFVGGNGSGKTSILEAINVALGGFFGSQEQKMQRLIDYDENYFRLFEIKEDRTISPLLAFYSTQRLFKDASLSGKQKYDVANGRRNGYLQCLKENAIKGVLNEWLGNAVTRRATLQIKEIDKVDLILENVEDVLDGFVQASSAIPIHQKRNFWQSQFDRILRIKNQPFRQFLLIFIGRKLGLS